MVYWSANIIRNEDSANCGKTVFPDKDGTAGVADNGLISGILARMALRAADDHQEHESRDCKNNMNQEYKLILKNGPYSRDW